MPLLLNEGQLIHRRHTEVLSPFVRVACRSHLHPHCLDACRSLCQPGKRAASLQLCFSVLVHRILS
jgi:hypothetical protein